MNARMALDLVALALLLAFAALGAWRGALATGLSLAGLVGGYAAGWLAATRLGGALAERLALSPLVAAPLAGTAAFLSVTLAFSLVAWVLRRRGAAPGAASRLGGALFGALRGSLVALAIGIAALWLDALRDLRPEADSTAVAAPRDTPLRAATRAAVETGVAAALGGDGAATRLATTALVRPAETAAQLRALAATAEVEALMADADFWSHLEDGALPAALAQPSFQRLQWNAERRQQVAALGLVDADAARDPALFARELRAALEQIAPRLRALRSDPDLARLASDPNVASMAANRDVAGLLAHPGFQRVVARALAPSPPEPSR